MKLSYLIFFLIFIYGCSFDNKTGIWENEEESLSKKNKIFDEFSTISISENIFQKELPFQNNLTFNIPVPKINKSWNDIYYSHNNNLENFKYNETNEVGFKSKKLSKHLVNENKLFENENLILNDERGNLIIFSTQKNKVISKFNFYKKRFKKIKKNINFAVKKNVIYAADNLGYIYAFDYKKEKIVWAKNYKVPFNSNLKIFRNKIIISNQNNNLYIINKDNGDLLKSFPTEEFHIKNKFKNNLSSSIDGQLFFLNSFGSLYSINLNSMKINWFNNFNQSLDLNISNYFEGSEIVSTEKAIIFSSNKSTYLIDPKNGSIIKKFNFSTKIKPIVIKNNMFIITSNGYFVSIDLINSNIIYSYNISKIEKFNSDTINNNNFKKIMILNGKFYLFLENSYVLILNIDGKFEKLIKLSAKIKTNPISINNSIIFLNKKNKMIILN